MIKIPSEILYSTSFKERIPTAFTVSILFLFLAFGWNFLLNQNILDPTLPDGLPAYAIFFHFSFYLVMIFPFVVLLHDLINYRIVLYDPAEDLLIINTRIFRDKNIRRNQIDNFLLINKERQKMKQMFLKKKNDRGRYGILLAMGEGEDVSIFLKRLREIYSDIPVKIRDPID